MTTVNEEGKALVEQGTFNKEKALAEFMEYIHTYLTDDECNQVLKAFELADKAHEGQLRASGEPYIMHPLAVAEILAHLQIDHITLMAALMHDVVEDTSPFGVNTNTSPEKTSSFNALTSSVGLLVSCHSRTWRNQATFWSKSLSPFLLPSL